MKKRMKQWLSIISVLAMLFCLTPPVTAETEVQEEDSPYVDITSLPDNIRLLLDLQDLPDNNMSARSAMNAGAVTPEINVLDTLGYR